MEPIHRLYWCEERLAAARTSVPIHGIRSAGGRKVLTCPLLSFT